MKENNSISVGALYAIKHAGFCNFEYTPSRRNWLLLKDTDRKLLLLLDFKVYNNFYNELEFTFLIDKEIMKTYFTQEGFLNNFDKVSTD